MPYWNPKESLEDYLNLALHLSGSAFGVELAAEPALFREPTESAPDSVPFREPTESAPEPAPFHEHTESSPEPAPFHEPTESAPESTPFREPTESVLFRKNPQSPVRSGSPQSLLLPCLPRPGLLLCMPHSGTLGYLCLQALFHYMVEDYLHLPAFYLHLDPDLCFSSVPLACTVTPGVLAPVMMLAQMVTQTQPSSHRT